ncbi:MAG: endonuclease MutS2 [Chitinophagales bacterium]
MSQENRRRSTPTRLYPRELYTKLEFDKVLELLTEKCYSPLGKQLVQKIRIQNDAERIERLLAQVSDFKQLLMVEEKPFPSHNYLDLKKEIDLLRINNSVLNEEQLFRIFKVLQTVFEISLYFGREGDEKRERYPSLMAILQDLNFQKDLLHQIKNIIDENGKIRTDASKELLNIRRAIDSQYSDLQKKFNAVINEYKKNNWLADTIESVRNGRRVLAVKAEHKRKFRGIVHDESSTGSISYIEPDTTLQISNAIVELQQAEKREIYRILQELTEFIRTHTEDLEHHQKLLGVLDFIRAKGQLAWDMNAHQPQISNTKTIEIYNARHPLLYLKNKVAKKETVPLNFELSLANRILVVSGPNAGGKSVMLKTVGLLQLMLQAGMLVPTNDHSVMTIFRNIFVDIGDEQSIENDLSTYSSRLRNMRFFVDHADAKTLLLIDEFGSGTDPALGGAIAETILERLNKKFCYGIITTHYSNLKVFATDTDGIVNGAMAFDYRTLSPLYKLEMGKPGSSFAFELAQKSGLKKDIIEEAKRRVDAEYKEFDELLSRMRKEKQEIVEKERALAAKNAQMDIILADYAKLKEGLEKQKKEIILETKEKALTFLQEANRRFENKVKTWNENKEDKQLISKIKQDIEKDKEKLNKHVEILKDKLYYRDTDKPIVVGSYVRLRDGKEIGEVTELRKNAAIVQFDLLKTHVKRKQLIVVEPVETKEEKKAVSYYSSPQAKSEFDTNIDVRGMRREEALSVVESLIDQALVYSVDELKIIHGIGDGILRKAIRRMLKTYKQVLEVRDEEPQYGGQGVSIVALQ